MAAGEGIIGEHHMVKWPIAKILVLHRPNDLSRNDKLGTTWDVRNNKTEILLR